MIGDLEVYMTQKCSIERTNYT